MTFQHSCKWIQIIYDCRSDRKGTKKISPSLIKERFFTI
jgi:hypothetical protein